ncbi:Cytochrome c oxidase subunit 6a, mitochondrial [Apostasia shenzhenica]|uniref:Cytochrome c oxidase subunit 6a, mitochondrial n=1 Tax=Apostasia shenzhenica TaxID=1088818 RepID=A0A2I0A4E0_9ASPA|nr:Cytochrome c oxidase subunit 6a, mitochondrial [Apostasia shenzhenica]
MAMPIAITRSTLRAAGTLLRRPADVASSRSSQLMKMRFASSAAHDDEYEMAKWEKITYFGIATCAILSVYHLSKGHEHHPEPPAFPYLHIRNKEFPWGPDGLFEKKKHGL